MPSALQEFAAKHDELLWALGAFSAVMFVFSVVGLPWLLARIPADYFITEPRDRYAEDGRWILWLLRKIIKNIFGLILFLAGLAMVGLPGQGLLTMLFGMSLLDFPGKRRLELNLIRRPKVLKAINWLRARRGRPPLLVEETPLLGVSEVQEVSEVDEPQTAMLRETEPVGHHDGKVADVHQRGSTLVPLNPDATQN